MLQKIMLLSLFSSKMIILEILWGRIRISKQLTWENNCNMGDISGAEEMHNNCGEVTHTGTLNGGINVLLVLHNIVKPL